MAQDTAFSNKKTLNLRGDLVSLYTQKVMGIINLTPDSFFEASRAKVGTMVLKRAEKMLENGALFLDLGGYSSRPGAHDVSVDEELRRVIEHIKNIRKELPELYISIDTFRAKVAKEALDHGADIINDISAGDLDKEMFELLGRTNAPYIAMHMRGTPQNMKEKTDYNDVTLEVYQHLKNKHSELRSLGVKDVILDPGFGFAKTAEQSYKLLKNLTFIKTIGTPLLVGVSRKSMIYKSLNVGPEDALNGTSILNTIALHNGADILRVHDVKEAAESIKLFNLTFS
ncbi:MAG: dihydropteroate synthase [Bacteroidota bacterium]